MAERNPYEVLGVGRQASDGEIKRAFRKLARQYHPDRNQGDAGAEAKFKEVQAAYDAIGTSEARREFDQQEQMRTMFGGGGRGRGGPDRGEHAKHPERTLCGIARARGAGGRRRWNRPDGGRSAGFHDAHPGAHRGDAGSGCGRLE